MQSPYLITRLQKHRTFGTHYMPLAFRNRCFLQRTVSFLILGTHPLLPFGKIFHWNWQCYSDRVRTRNPVYTYTFEVDTLWQGGILDSPLRRSGDADGFIFTWCTELLFLSLIFFYHKAYLHSLSWRCGTLAVKRVRRLYPFITIYTCSFYCCI